MVRSPCIDIRPGVLTLPPHCYLQLLQQRSIVLCIAHYDFFCRQHLMPLPNCLTQQLMLMFIWLHHLH